MKKEKKWFVYMARCRDNSLYTGITDDVKSRIEKHNSGKGAKYIVASRRPAVLAWKKKLKNKSEALETELKIKKMSKSEKEKIVKRGKI